VDWENDKTTLTSIVVAYQNSNEINDNTRAKSREKSIHYCVAHKEQTKSFEDNVFNHIVEDILVFKYDVIKSLSSTTAMTTKRAGVSGFLRAFQASWHSTGASAIHTQRYFNGKGKRTVKYQEKA
jgi:hypothetical protein